MAQARVVLITSGIYPLTIGGKEKQTLFLAKELALRGVEVTVLSAITSKKSLWQRIFGVDCYLAAKGKKGFTASLYCALKWLGFLCKNRGDFNIVIARQAYSAALVACVIKLIFRKKIIIMPTAALEFINLNRSFFGKARIAVISRCADLFISISGDITREMKRNNIDGARIAEIPNGVDSEEFAPAPKEEKPRMKIQLGLREGFYFIYCGRMEEIKGVSFLLEAWRLLSKDLPDCRLLLCGSGSKEKELRNLARDLGIGSSADFLGGRQNIADYLKVSDVFVLPSLHEGSSNALLEAMSCALPVIATAVGGTPGIISDGNNGIATPARDVVILAQKMSLLYFDEALRLRLGEAARETVLKWRKQG